MWRSFFYAVGIGLFALGLEGLVFDHVLIPKDMKIQKLIKRIVSDRPAGPNLNAGVDQQYPNFDQRANSVPTQASQTSRFAGFDSGSRYGPSRFAGPAYGAGYGGGRVGSGSIPVSGSNVDNFQGLGQGNAQFAGYQGNRGNETLAGPQRTGGLQIFMIREWMPWSLLASGAIIFLYTRTVDRRRSDD